MQTVPSTNWLPPPPHYVDVDTLCVLGTHHRRVALDDERDDADFGPFPFFFHRHTLFADDQKNVFYLFVVQLLCICIRGKEKRTSSFRRKNPSFFFLPSPSFFIPLPGFSIALINFRWNIHRLWLGGRARQHLSLFFHHWTELDEEEKEGRTETEGGLE